MNADTKETWIWVFCIAVVLLLSAKLYYEANQDRIKVYRDANKEKAKEYREIYHQENRHLIG